MSIVLIKGPPKSGKSHTANALRNMQISNRRGALMIDEANEADLTGLLEKLLIGVTLPNALATAVGKLAEGETPEAAIKRTDLKTLPWKPQSMVILVGAKESVLAQIEEKLPGFTAAMGPIFTITTGTA